MFIADKRSRRWTRRKSTESIFIIHPYSQRDDDYRQCQRNGNIDGRQLIHELLCKCHLYRPANSTVLNLKVGDGGYEVLL